LIKKLNYSIAYLRKIDPYVFEELLLEALLSKGFKITRNKRYSGDGGIDWQSLLQGAALFHSGKTIQQICVSSTS